jgi:hypothetical protein
MGFFEKLLSWPPSHDVEKRLVRVDDTGFEVLCAGEPKIRVTWDSVIEIAGFKHDLFSYDEICLGFRCTDEDQFLWAGEEDIGFDSLLKEVERRFSDLRPGWYRAIAVPAFQENWTSIWLRRAPG